MTGLRLVALLLAAVVGTHGSSYPTDVVELTDKGFEHDTQAASGQTTGVWAVLFTDSNLKRHERAVLVVEELARDEDKELIYAQVDVGRNIKLGRRFGAVLFPPCILLFRDRQMYLFDMSFDREDIGDRIREFVTSGYANTSPMPVPEHVERTLNLQAIEEGNKMDMRVVFVAVLMIVGGLVFQTWAMVNKEKFKPEEQPAGKGQAGVASKSPAKGKAKAS